MVLILKIKKRYYLKKKKVKEIKKELGDYGSFIGNKDTLELLESEDYDFILVNADISFRISNIPAVWNTMKNLSSIATPLALLVLGAQFEFSAVKSLWREVADLPRLNTF